MGNEAIPFKERLLELQSRVNYIQFDKKNEHQGWKFASSENVFSTFMKEAVKIGICVKMVRTQLLFSQIDEASFMRSLIHRTVFLEDVYSTEGAQFEGVGEGRCKQGTSVMKAATAALKYALQAAGIIAWGEDDVPVQDDQELTMNDKEPPTKVAIPKNKNGNQKGIL